MSDLPKARVMPRLLSDDDLEQSCVVANCRMNRERELLGTNGYDVELGFNPFDQLLRRAASTGHTNWLDMCCGSGRALIAAAHAVELAGLGDAVEIVGIDLVGMFAQQSEQLKCLRLVEASLTEWEPDGQFDLISCVHGLHYIGDKLGLVKRAASWLTPSGNFTASFSVDSVKIANKPANVRSISAELRKRGLRHDQRRKRLTCEGYRQIDFPWRYLGADDQTGPNYTGQAAVDSYYEWLE